MVKVAVMVASRAMPAKKLQLKLAVFPGSMYQRMESVFRPLVCRTAGHLLSSMLTR